MLGMRRRATDQVTQQIVNPMRRATDRVMESASAATEQISQSLSQVSRRGNEAAKSAYGYAMNHPKSTTAVVLGTAVAAGLLWFMQRNGGYQAVRRQVLQRVRGNGGTRTRSRRPQQQTNAAAE